MYKRLVLFFGLTLVAQSVLAQDEQLPKRSSSDRKSEMSDLWSQAKNSVQFSFLSMKKHPMPTIKMVGGSWCMFYGAARLLHSYNNSVAGYLIDAAVGLPMIALGVYLLGNGIHDVEKPTSA